MLTILFLLCRRLPRILQYKLTKTNLTLVTLLTPLPGKLLASLYDVWTSGPTIGAFKVLRQLLTDIPPSLPYIILS